MKEVITLTTFIFCFAFSQAQNINTYAGTTFGNSGNGGPAIYAQLEAPEGVAVDTSGNLYIADSYTNQVRVVNHASGIITLFAGNSNFGYSGDGGQATAAELYQPTGVAVDDSGNVYIADEGNNVVRKVYHTTKIITTVAGNHTAGYSGDGSAATAAELYWPYGVGVDASGNIYVADNYNQRIRKVTRATGIITTFAGNGTSGYSGNGGAATAAELSSPYAVIANTSGDVFISDDGNAVIRKVDHVTGNISTFAGNGTSGYSGNGGPATAAELAGTRGIAFNAAGDLYISDMPNDRVRKVDITGIITLTAGNGTQGYTGDGGPAIAAELNLVKGVAVDKYGVVYLADIQNNVVRYLSAPLSVNEISNSKNVAVYPNPSNGRFTIKMDNTFNGNTCLIEAYNILGERVYSQILNFQNSTLEINLSGEPSGIYLYRIVDNDSKLLASGKIAIQ
jgi:hypothetical protein